MLAFSISWSLRECSAVSSSCWQSEAYSGSALKHLLVSLGRARECPRSVLDKQARALSGLDDGQSAAGAAQCLPI